METKEMFSVIAGILSICGLALYIRSIIVGETKPAKASWIIWATITTITMISLYLEGSINGQIVGSTIGNWGVVIALFRYKSIWKPSHKFYIASAFVGIVLSVLFRDPMFAIAISLGVTLIGAFPTFSSTWEDSNREYKPTWTLYAISCIFVLLAIPELSVKDCIQPITYAIVGGVMIYLLYLRPKSKQNPMV